MADHPTIFSIPLGFARTESCALVRAWMESRSSLSRPLMLPELMALARDLGAAVCTLEVRLGNAGARRLYQEFGFKPVGVRPRYYTDNAEDALIMTTPPLRSLAMERLMRKRREIERHRLVRLFTA